MTKKMFDFQEAKPERDVGMVFKKGSKINNKTGLLKTPGHTYKDRTGETVIFERRGIDMEGLVKWSAGGRHGVEVDGYTDLQFINEKDIIDEK